MWSEVCRLISLGEVRGFSPVQAGNSRIDGLYYDGRAVLSNRLISGSTVRVGLSAQSYAFPASTGIVDYSLRAAGKKRMLSVSLQSGPYGSRAAEADLAVPLTPAVSLTAGLASRSVEDPPGQRGRIVCQALGLRLRPLPWLELKPFWSKVKIDRDVLPIYQVAGDVLPSPPVERFLGQAWAENHTTSTLSGLIADASPGRAWKIRAGLFNSVHTTHESFADMFRDVRADGSGLRTIVANPEQNAATRSGELRISYRTDEGPRRHALHASMRGRSMKASRGGSAFVPLGRMNIKDKVDVVEPDLSFGPLTWDRLRQTTAGLAYEGAWRDVGEVSVGLQRTAYRKTVMKPGAASAESREALWLWNATAALYIRDKLALYAGYTRGLEEAGVAPDNATNRLEVLPPMRTRQADAGFRYALSSDLRLIAGVFEVTKPYYNLSSTNLFTTLGEVQHRGVELSLAGRVAAGLNLVAGAVLMDPRVTGEAVQNGRVGRRPVGQTNRLLRLNLDYALPFASGVSVDLGIVNNGARTVSTDNHMNLPARTIVDLGARYRFRAAGSAASLRLQVANLFHHNGWLAPNSSGTLQPLFPRRVTGSLAIDI
jgi:iron complex outermembrane receptor protein